MNWNEVLGTVLAALIPVLATAVAGVIALLGKRVDTWLATKIQNEQLSNTLRRLNDAVWHVVLELHQTEVDALKKATAEDGPGGRAITAEEAAGLRDLALTKLKSYLGPAGLEQVKRVLGLTETNLDDYLRTVIESTVRNSKLGSFPGIALETTV